jgi:hypothetical protein
MAEETNNQVAPPALFALLRDHFDVEPSTLPVLQQRFDEHDRPNLHLALQEMLGQPHTRSEMVGVVTLEHYREASLAQFSREASARNFDRGPVEYVDVALPGDRHLACLKHALILARIEDQPLALLLTVDPHRFRGSPIIVEVMAAARERAEQFLRQLARRTHHGKAYRGHVLSLEPDCYGNLNLQFHHLPSIGRENLILPAALLDRIERHTLRFSKHGERLRAARRHLKRGILLHGPPGTGKTLTAMYLVAQMPGRTVLLLTGAGQGTIQKACHLARLLEPATVILEDVDLIGTQRERQTVGANAVLFELLNQMDGLSEDADILFLLTTNRPEILEPALASRPGRIDQAIAVSPPDADCRRRLFELYGKGMRVEVSDWGRLIERTAGASGAFIREVLRKAAVFAADEGGDGELVVQDAHLDEAIAELLVAGGDLTRSLLGVVQETGASASPRLTPG